MDAIVRKILRPIEQDEKSIELNSPDFSFWCPGCKGAHQIWVHPDKNVKWKFNGNLEKPTFEPSIKVDGTVPITDEEAERIMAGEKITPRPLICHMHVIDGMIHYLGDCTHALAGQVIPMEAF